MLLLDDILLAPIRGVLWVCEKVEAAAQDAVAGDEAELTNELRELYLLLETGRISEVEFDGREAALLDRLDAIRQETASDGDELEGEELAGDEDDDT